MGKEAYWIISKYATPHKYPRHFGLGKAMVRAGKDVSLICSVSNSVAPNDVPHFKGWKKVEYHDGLKVIWLNGLKLRKNGIRRIISWFLFELQVITIMWQTKHKPKAILVSSLSLLSVFSGILLSRRHGARFNFEVRDIWPLSLIELSGISPKNPLVQFLSFTERLGYRKAHTIVGTMPNLSEYVSGLNEAWAKKVICVPQGLDQAIFEEQAEPLPYGFQEKYLPEDKFIVAYTGTLNPNNPIDTLINAAESTAESHTNIYYVILGSGANREKYQAQVAHLDNICFPPLIAKNQMASMLQHVDVGYDAVSDGVGRFGLSRNKWIDYMYNRCIMICSNDGYQSMVNEADSGYFVPFGDVEALVNKIVEVAQKPQKELDAMKNRGKDFILQNHSFDFLAQKYMDKL